MKNLLIVGLLLAFHALSAQSLTGFQPTYRLLSSGNRVADKNFYFLTVIQQTSAL